ncbi:hypothetical protein JOE48_002776 [Methylobacterium sp. PvR107]|nr:hypothetical protein [Methylobacterium sp. PvR107]
MPWAYTKAPTGSTAESPDAARRTVRRSASGTAGAVWPAQDSALPRGTAPAPGDGAANS